MRRSALRWSDTPRHVRFPLFRFVARQGRGRADVDLTSIFSQAQGQTEDGRSLLRVADCK